MAAEQRYSTDQVVTAARELRAAAGADIDADIDADEQRFTGREVIDMLDDEIRLLRERGFTDQRIAQLFSGFDIQVTTKQIAQHAPPTL